jgi:GcrA cell cycle regulator
MPFNWDEESKNKLRELWAGDLSASLIGKEMGLTKNSIIGAANRMKLPPRVTPPAFTARSGVLKKQEQPVNISAVEPQERPVEDVQTPAPVVAAKLKRILYTPGNATMKTCRFPSGDPKKSDFRFCGRPTVTGKSYCLACCNIAYIKPSRAA